VKKEKKVESEKVEELKQTISRKGWLRENSLTIVCL
jgi:hypothetical protein